jgi:hypothetical protein
MRRQAPTDKFYIIIGSKRNNLVKRMNKKIFALVIIVAISAFLLIPLTTAADPQPPGMMAWTDKTDYAPGESGTLHIVFYNDRPYAVTIQKIFVVFNGWWVYKDGEWEGNQTLTANEAVAVNETYVTSVKFTVPTDGRAESTAVSITFRTAEIGDVPLIGSVAVTVTPRFMDQIVTLFTVQVVLIIVGTIIIAATIFLSARRPQVTWKAEEKAQ